MNHQEHRHENATGVADELATCPVMNVPVSMHEAETSNLVKQYKGVKYYLCCNACTTMFESDTAQYIHNKENGSQI